MSKEQKYHHEVMRCPQCLRYGQMRVNYGNYVCDDCDQAFGVTHVSHFNQAFNTGREYERKHPNEQP